VKAVLRRADAVVASQPPRRRLRARCAWGRWCSTSRATRCAATTPRCKLTVTEFGLLAALMERPGVVLSRAQLMERAYAYDNLITERTIDTHVKRVRKKFRDAGHDPDRDGARRRLQAPRGMSARGSVVARWTRALHSIRARLLLVNAFLVIVPIAGISFARTYERELLRSEEEGMVPRQGLAATASADDPRDLAPPRCARARGPPRAAPARRCECSTCRDGWSSTPAPSGSSCAARGDGCCRSRSIRRAVRRVAGARPHPGDGSFRARPEVARALAGSPGRYARRIPNLRGFGLFVAEPVRASPASPTQGAVYVCAARTPCCSRSTGCATR
jgi:hypothetical protein